MIRLFYNPRPQRAFFYEIQASLAVETPNVTHKTPIWR
jgi:hypothetical protein